MDVLVHWRFACAQLTASHGDKARSDNKSVFITIHPNAFRPFKFPLSAESLRLPFYTITARLTPLPRNVFLSSDLLSSSPPLFSIYGLA